MTAARIALLTALALGALGSPAQATSLFQSRPHARATVAVPAWATPATVDTAVVAAFARGRRETQLDGIPVGGGDDASFRVSPIEVFAPRATIVAFDGVIARPLARPDVSVFEGQEIGERGRRIVLSVVDGRQVWAIIRDGTSAISAIQPILGDGAAGAHAVIDLRSAPASGGHVCDGAVVGEPATAAPSTARLAPLPTTLAAEVLVDVGYDLLSTNFASSESAAATYAANVFAGVSGLFRRDVGVAILIGELVVWTAPDPFTGVSKETRLRTYQSWNEEHRDGVARDIAHLLVTSDTGGIAYLDRLCSTRAGYGVSNVDPTSTSLPSTGFVWDVNVVAHEIGHNFGSSHTHCYSPPIDRCYNQESGCYGGPVVASVGETMSYCHLVGSVDMGFGSRVGAVVRAGAEAAACIGAAPGTCGDGILDPGEQCDDANTLAGDCCSPACTSDEGEACSDDGDPCTRDVCDRGVCVHAPPGSCSVCDVRTVIPPAGGTVSGRTDPRGTPDGRGSTSGTCGLTGNAPEQVFEWTPDAWGTATITTCSPSTEFDTVVYVRRAACDGEQVACRDDDSACGAGSKRSTVTFTVTGGETYEIVVDGFDGAYGAFTLHVTPPGGCDPAGVAVCDDGDACTADLCDPRAGCSHGPVACDDGNACTDDRCDAEVGCVHTATRCDDDDACTSDGCDPARGCTRTALACRDDDECTIDVCDATRGCVFTAQSGAGGVGCRLDAVARALTSGAAAGQVTSTVSRKLSRVATRAAAVARSAAGLAAGKQQRKRFRQLRKQLTVLRALIARHRDDGLSPEVADAMLAHVGSAMDALGR